MVGSLRWYKTKHITTPIILLHFHFKKTFYNKYSVFRIRLLSCLNPNDDGIESICIDVYRIHNGPGEEI